MLETILLMLHRLTGRQKTPMTPVINQVLELDKRRSKTNRIKKLILLRISGCILGWGQELLHKSTTAFVKSRAHHHWQTSRACPGKHWSSAYMFFSACLTMNRGFSHQKEKTYSETVHKFP